MTDAEKIILVKAMTDETDDATISAFLSMAGDAVYHYVDPYKGHDKTEILEDCGGPQVRIAADWLNKRSADGQIAMTENGISRTWEAADIPPSILRELTPYCGVVS